MHEFVLFILVSSTVLLLTYMHVTYIYMQVPTQEHRSTNGILLHPPDVSL